MGLLTVFQEKLIFLPTKLEADHPYEFGYPFREFFFDAPDGARLNGLHFTVEKPKGLLLYFHGNAGDLSRWGTIVQFFVGLGYDVLLMDYRTYGKSTGELGEEALYTDAQLFYEYALQFHKADDIIIYGRSLGCTFATYVASKNKANKLILETPFYNLKEVAKARFPFLPIEWLLKYRFPTNTFINGVSFPICIFHGTEDTVVPYESGLRLFESISSNDKKMVTIDGGEHNDLIEFDAYHKGIAEILQSKSAEDR